MSHLVYPIPRHLASVVLASDIWLRSFSPPNNLNTVSIRVLQHTSVREGCYNSESVRVLRHIEHEGVTTHKCAWEAKAT